MPEVTVVIATRDRLTELRRTLARGLLLRARRPVPPAVEGMIRAVDEPRRASRARRYVG